ncbi:MAG: preprotein translocase subunit SecA [Rickettsiales bacterium]|nr:preprotein translocase subunit SecA [Pseudomonadota bacterium]MDA0965987.1 preprotein translocase subunit SecA [Pseudomonadota bacterium]MDG4542542.1 preprotein translocase subunit SecA [Rickettsiales bacterium]MDG4545046.1 preprotein translocase subunit SecA [Rickettsiales bacterium]MDG4547169.1 preprotein translocase subunit SecA [Rickettsiales bacterium]
MKFNSLAKKMFGTANDRILKSMQAIVNQINSLEEGIKSLSDNQLKNKTDEFKQRLKDGASIDDILPEAFAVVREVSWRVMGMRHFDVQLLGGIILHRGMIAEMKTGEGKTLSATLPVYLNALEGKGVHVVTVNDYLAQRDSKWMGQIYGFLGMSVSCVINSLDDEERQAAYGADITYGTNNEFGFDYLRDNMKFSKEEMVQRGFNYAIVDEVDSILIDEARTPLIISGPTEDNSELYHKVDKLIPLLDEKDYEKDEKARSVTLTEDGTEKIEQILKNEGLLDKDGNLYDLTSISLVHHINQALRAHTLFAKDTDYIVKDGKVIIIDEFTGRMMEGRRFSDGMHQALEAKENVPVQNENQTLASVTFQNYFRLYNKLAGMTGTAMTEANEFADIYKLEVVAVPPNLKVARIDDNDDIYSTALEKYEAIADKIEECHKSNQPVLVGTISIEQSELVASFLKKKKIPHNVLNAKQHAKEAYIIAQAGRIGAVTIATNMAGRGTDIMLGGNFDMMVEEEITKSGSNADRKAIEIRIKEQIKNEKQKVIEAGGLFVLGTERHESRRIDNQLRGRSGRQGDPGMSKFYLSLEDDLMRIFGSEKIQGLLKTFGLKDGEAIAHPMISRSIEKAQQKVEAHNYEIRKSLLKFDDVMNDQRKVIYEQRLELMTTEDVSQDVKDMRDEVTENIVNTFIPAKSYPDQWDTEAMEKEIFRLYGIHADVTAWAKEEGVADKEILEKLDAQVDMLFEGKEKLYTPPIMRMIEKRILLITLDQLWKEHLLGLDHLKQGIGLRAYGQKDPLNEYKREAFKMFEAMLQRLNEVVTIRLAHIELSEEQRDRQVISQRPKSTQKMKESRVDPALQRDAPVAVLATAVTRVSPEERDPADPESWGRVGRNEPCPCGSGKKYKQCHGQI